MKANNHDIKLTIEKIARSIFFIIFIGGLFLFISYTLENICNLVIFNTFKIPCINTLEAAGIVGFAYIIIYGINFGIKSMRSEMTNRHKTKRQHSDV